MAHMFVPGPVDVQPEILASQTQPMLPHRSEAFETIYRRAWQKSQPLFSTQSRVFIVTSSGTGLQEAAVRNLAKQDILSCVNGAFSQRWYEVAQTNGKQPDLLEVDWGLPITPDRVADALVKKKYEMIMLVQNETSTGVQNPISEIAATVRTLSPDTLICIDAVSSLGGVKVEMDTWELDLVLTSSQKCLALPPGLALAAVSDRAMDYARGVPDRGWYFDLIRMEEHLNKDSTPATPALSLIYALEAQLEHIFKEGLAARFTRHSVMAQQVQEWIFDNGFEILAPEGYRSQTVTTVNNTQGVDFNELNSYLMQKEMRIANGYGRLKDKTFRIAHMGETQPEDIDRLLIALEEFLSQN